jgi:hypothetical protein
MRVVCVQTLANKLQSDISWFGQKAHGPTEKIMKPDETNTPPQAAKEKYFYFVDGEKFESDSEFTTGAIIKSKLPEAKRGYALFLEGHGNEPDTLINDDTSVSLEKDKGPKRFYTVPAASFGLA